MSDLSILISEYNSNAWIEEGANHKSILDICLQPPFQTIMKHIAADIANAELKGKYCYQFRVQVIAQKENNITNLEYCPHGKPKSNCQSCG